MSERRLEYNTYSNANVAHLSVRQWAILFDSPLNITSANSGRRLASGVFVRVGYVRRFSFNVSQTPASSEGLEYNYTAFAFAVLSMLSQRECWVMGLIKPRWRCFAAQ